MKRSFICCLLISLFSSLPLFGQKYVLIHGWLGDGGDWENTAVTNLIQSEYATQVYKPSLNGTASSNSQAYNLSVFLSNHSINDGVALSFSMGAMNTRRYFRNAFELLEPIRVTHHYSIGGTHYGTPVATNLESGVRILVAGAAAAVYPGELYDNGTAIQVIDVPYGVMGWAAAILTASEFCNGLIYFVGGPALLDLRENSTAVNMINLPGPNYYENDVTKVGIIGTEIDPVLWRLAAGSFGIEENVALDIVDEVTI